MELFCNPYFQNSIIVLILILYWFFVLKSKPLPFTYISEKENLLERIYDQERSHRIWLVFVAGSIFIIYSFIEKLALLSIILSVFGIKTCNC